MLENAFLIPLVPTISFVVILFFGKKFIGADRVHVVGIGALGLVWILSAVAAFQWIQRVEDPPPDAVVKIEHHDDHGDAHAGDDHGDAMRVMIMVMPMRVMIMVMPMRVMIMVMPMRVMIMVMPMRVMIMVMPMAGDMRAMAMVEDTQVLLYGP